VVYGGNILISHGEKIMQIHDLTNNLAELREDKVYMLVNEYVNAKISANLILKALWNGMSIVGDRYKDGRYFISEMMFAGEIMRKVMLKLNPILDKEGGVKEIIGKVILGTVKGDIHDLGKDIVKMVLGGNGFHVVDLGVDVAAERFIEAIKSHPDAKVIGMSVLLTSVFPSLENIVSAIKAAGLHDKIKIMIGGGAVTARVAEETRCDFYGEDAVAAVSYSKEIYRVE
jgi:methanogenic corrinoid protein MtbC1